METFRNLWLVALVLMGNVALGQDFKVKGQVYSNEGKEPNLEVILYKGENGLKSVLTDKEGMFLLKAEKGNYTVVIRQLANEMYRNDIVLDKDIDLGAIVVDNTTALQEVVVVGKKQVVEQKVDRTVFNVENSAAASTGTVLDMLKITPKVQVKDDSVSIIGKGGVLVYIDDIAVKLSGEELTKYLSSFSASDVKNIEVITTPPSRYEAEGNSGILNIVLKKARANSWSDTVGGEYEQGYLASYSLRNSFNYNKDKFSFFMTTRGGNDRYRQILESKIKYPNMYWDGTSTMSSDYGKRLNNRMGADYKVSKKASVGFVYGYYKDKEKMDMDDVVRQFAYSDLQKSINEMRTTGDNKGNTTKNDVNVHWVQKLDTLGKKFSVDLDYLKTKSDEKQIMNVVNRVPYLESGKDNTTKREGDNYGVKVDVSLPVSYGEWGFGGKISQSKVNNDVKFYNIEGGVARLTGESDNFDYSEDIQAVYGDFSKSFSEKFQAKVGLRGENTKTKGVSHTVNREDTNEYFKWFPTVFLNYVANENNTVNVSYSRRFQRPSFWVLNPARHYLNPNSYQQGNPYLKPTIFDNFEVSHNYKNMFMTSVAVTKIGDSYSQIMDVDPAQNMQRFIHENYIKGWNYGLSETIIYSPTDWWDTTTMLSVSTGKYKFTDKKYEKLGDVKNVKPQFYMTMNHAFRLDKEGNYKAEADWFYSGKSVEVDKEMDALMSLNLSFKAMFLDKSLTVSLGVDDVFDNFVNIGIKSNTSGVEQNYVNNNSQRNVRFGVSYKFGNKKISVQERKGGNSEEAGRM